MSDDFTEIERKFLIHSFPADLPLQRQFRVFQAYLSDDPETRIRRHVKNGIDIAHFLTIKAGSGLTRTEVEIEISEAQFTALSTMIEHPFITKDYRVYQLDNGLELECSLVDEGMGSQFMYAEVEFPDVETAEAFIPPDICGQEVTGDPAYAMKNFWKRTRG